MIYIMRVEDESYVCMDDIDFEEVHLTRSQLFSRVAYYGSVFGVNYKDGELVFDYEPYTPEIPAILFKNRVFVDYFGSMFGIRGSSHDTIPVSRICKRFANFNSVCNGSVILKLDDNFDATAKNNVFSESNITFDVSDVTDENILLSSHLKFKHIVDSDIVRYEKFRAIASILDSSVPYFDIRITEDTDSWFIAKFQDKLFNKTTFTFCYDWFYSWDYDVHSLENAEEANILLYQMSVCSISCDESDLFYTYGMYLYLGGRDKRIENAFNKVLNVYRLGEAESYELSFDC